MSIPLTTSFQWIDPKEELPLHKELVEALVDHEITKVWYSARECGWFNQECQRIKVSAWMKWLLPPGQEHLRRTEFFKKKLKT